MDMRAKMRVSDVQENFYGDAGAKSSETLSLHAIAANSYPADGSDEDNTYAQYTPSANLEICISNPALWGKFKVNDRYYVDFTRAAE